MSTNQEIPGAVRSWQRQLRSSLLDLWCAGNAHRLTLWFYASDSQNRIVVVVQSHSCVPLFVTPWTAARQTSLSITNSRRLIKLTCIESVMPSKYLILCHPLLLLPSIFPRIRVFTNELALRIGGQSIGASTSASVLPMNIQD